MCHTYTRPLSWICIRVSHSKSLPSARSSSSSSSSKSRKQSKRKRESGGSFPAVNYTTRWRTWLDSRHISPTVNEALSPSVVQRIWAGKQYNAWKRTKMRLLSLVVGRQLTDKLHHTHTHTHNLEEEVIKPHTFVITSTQCEEKQTETSAWSLGYQVFQSSVKGPPDRKEGEKERDEGRKIRKEPKNVKQYVEWLQNRASEQFLPLSLTRFSHHNFWQHYQWSSS